MQYTTLGRTGFPVLQPRFVPRSRSKATVPALRRARDVGKLRVHPDAALRDVERVRLGTLFGHLRGFGLDAPPRRIGS